MQPILWTESPTGALVGCWFTPALHKDTVDSPPHWDSLGLFVKKVFAKIPFLDRLDTPPAQCFQLVHNPAPGKPRHVPAICALCSGLVKYRSSLNRVCPSVSHQRNLTCFIWCQWEEISGQIINHSSLTLAVSKWDLQNCKYTTAGQGLFWILPRFSWLSNAGFLPIWGV